MAFGRVHGVQLLQDLVEAGRNGQDGGGVKGALELETGVRQEGLQPAPPSLVYVGGFEHLEGVCKEDLGAAVQPVPQIEALLVRRGLALEQPFPVARLRGEVGHGRLCGGWYVVHLAVADGSLTGEELGVWDAVCVQGVAHGLAGRIRRIPGREPATGQNHVKRTHLLVVWAGE